MMRTFLLTVAFLAVAYALPSWRDEYRMQARFADEPRRYRNDEPRRSYFDVLRREHDGPQPRRPYGIPRDAPRQRMPYYGIPSSFQDHPRMDPSEYARLRDQIYARRRQQIMAEDMLRRPETPVVEDFIPAPEIPVEDPIPAPKPELPAKVVVLNPSDDIAELESLDQETLPSKKESDDEPLAAVAKQDTIKVIEADVKVEAPKAVADEPAAPVVQDVPDAKVVLAKPIETIVRDVPKVAPAPVEAAVQDVKVAEEKVAEDTATLTIVKDEPLAIVNDAPKTEVASTNEAYNDILNAKLPESPVDKPVIADPVVAAPKAADPVAPAPVAADPVAPAPKAADPVAPVPKAANPVVPAPVAADPVAPAPVAADPVAPAPVAADPVAAAPKAADPVAAAPKAADPVAAVPKAADPVAPAPAAAEPVAAEPAVADPVAAAPVDVAPVPEAADPVAPADPASEAVAADEEPKPADALVAPVPSSENKVGPAEEYSEYADIREDPLFQAVHRFMQDERAKEIHQREMMAQRRDYIRRMTAAVQRQQADVRRQERLEQLQRRDPRPHYDPTGQLRNYPRSRQYVHAARDQRRYSQYD